MSLSTTQFGASEARKRLSELLVRAAGGEVITITRYGRPVARLGPSIRERLSCEVDSLMARARFRRERLPATDWNELKLDRDGGHRF